MHRQLRPSRASLAVIVALAAIAVACGTSQVVPSTTAPSGSGDAFTPNPSGSAGTSSSDGSPLASEGANPSDAATTTPTEPFSPPPVGDPQADEACLAVLPGADVEAALGAAIGDIVAVGTDPAVNLTCTYAFPSGGSLLVTAAAGDAAATYQSNLDLATGYGQGPVTIDGLGDQAFYAKSADRWPEQVVFVKGPVLVRLVNQTSSTVGEVPFAALATTAADAIRAEIPPAP